jgi:hypothetical protein
MNSQDPGGVQGWRQLVVAKHDMLSAFTSALEKASNRPVPYFEPGQVAEGQFRKWLAEFLPERYGVTSGYIISSAANDTETLMHFDVIVYDKLDSPVLWQEDNPDSSKQGHSRAIPVEYVLAVLEVKSTFTKVAASEAIQKLRQLGPLLARVDDPSDYYPKYLPSRFSCGVCFFQVDPKKKADELTSLIAPDIRGYFGGIVLAPNTDRQCQNSGLIDFMRTPEPMLSTGKEIMPDSGSGVWSESQEVAGAHICAMINWSIPSFSTFAFRLLRLLQGTYQPGRVPSWYGFVTSAGQAWRDGHSLTPPPSE